jgi:ABC-type nitrate/sulfonate/bicarbonate transport system permease component
LKNHQGYLQIIPWMIPGIILGTWFLVSRSGWVPDYLLPDPVRIAEAGYHYLFAPVGSGPYAGRFLLRRFSQSSCVLTWAFSLRFLWVFL